MGCVAPTLLSVESMLLLHLSFLLLLLELVPFEPTVEELPASLAKLEAITLVVV